MPVSKKMKQAPLALAGIAQGELYYFDEEQLNKAVQEAVNKAWTDFDPEDESTWPYPLDTLLGAFFWCEDEDGDIDYMEYDIYQWKRYKTIRYADPQDLKFEEDE